MMMHNPETNEIAKPSELLNSVKAIMSVLQSIENYGRNKTKDSMVSVCVEDWTCRFLNCTFPSVHIDIARVFNNVLPQQTQPTDSFSGDRTITSNYTQWYLEVLLRRVSAGHIVYSPNHKAFVSLSTEGQLPFNAEEYADLMGERVRLWSHCVLMEWQFRALCV